MFDDMRIQLVPLLGLNSDKWHADETVIKIAGVKHYIWFIIDSEPRSLFVSIICGMLLHYGPRAAQTSILYSLTLEYRLAPWVPFDL